MEAIKKISRARSVDMTIAFTDLRRSLKTQWKNIYILTVVSIVGVIQQSVVPPQVFPYMRMLDPEVTPTFYGYLSSVWSLANVMAAGTAGWVSNKINQTKIPIMTGKMCAITSCTVYLLVEYFKTTYAQKVAFVAYEFFSGLSMGAVGILRAYVAMASTESDRSRAVAITTMSIPLGILIGPVIQLLFTPIGYPGVTVFTGGHINMYTAPVIFALLCNIMALLLLIFYFKDKTTATRSRGSIRPNHIIVNKEEFDAASVSSTAGSEKIPVDWLAVGACFVTKLVVGLILINARVVMTPYTMVAFNMTSAETVYYYSLITSLVGAFGIVVHTVYIFTKITNWVPERFACTVACAFFTLFYLVTYPWPFLSHKLKPDSLLEVLSNDEFNITLPNAVENKAPVLVTEKAMECMFEWCAKTPAINFYVYWTSLVFLMGAFFPILMINLDILFSKLLGNMKQGTLQGLFLISGDILNIVGPIILSNVYEAHGPTFIWLFLIFSTSSCTLMWIVMYRRMVPNHNFGIQ